MAGSAYPFNINSALQTVTGHIRAHLLERMAPVTQRSTLSLREIRDQNWFPNAIRYARNRMVMGFFRYGAIKDQKAGLYDNVGSAIVRLKLYQKNGNTEHLIDALNLCGIEFENPGHPNAHFIAIDDGLHTQKKGR